MADIRVTDRNGRELVVSSKDQADYWVGLGYTLAGEKPSPAQKATKKAAPRKRTAPKS